MDRTNIIAKLQTDILRLQGFKSINSGAADLGLGLMRHAFPNGTFPIGCVHEFISTCPEDITATNGFVAGVLSSLMKNRGASLWISTSRKLFPPALKNFGLEPDRFIFIDLRREKDVLWTIEEALKCGALTTVIGEIQDITFTESRRLQLAVEQSNVTGFLLRKPARKINPTACVSRWKISSLASEVQDDLPGIGFPQWRVELLRMRNGKSGAWNVTWMNDNFRITATEIQKEEISIQKYA